MRKYIEIVIADFRGALNDQDCAQLIQLPAMDCRQRLMPTSIAVAAGFRGKLAQEERPPHNQRGGLARVRCGLHQQQLFHQAFFILAQVRTYPLQRRSVSATSISRQRIFCSYLYDSSK